MRTAGPKPRCPLLRSGRIGVIPPDRRWSGLPGRRRVVCSAARARRSALRWTGALSLVNLHVGGGAWAGRLFVFAARVGGSDTGLPGHRSWVGGCSPSAAGLRRRPGSGDPRAATRSGMTHLQFQAERYPVEAMSEALHQQRPMEEAAMVSVPVWVVMEALQVVAEVRRGTGDAHPDRAGMLDAVRHVLSSQGRVALEAAGFPSEPGVVRGERCEVRLWPADRAWSPIRDEHTSGEVRPVQLLDIHRYWRSTVRERSFAPRSMATGLRPLRRAVDCPTRSTPM